MGRGSAAPASSSNQPARSIVDRDDNLKQRGERSSVRFDACRHERLSTVLEDHDISRLDVRRGMLELAQVITCVIVDAIERQGARLMRPWRNWVYGI
jgi:hypothetical protein